MMFIKDSTFFCTKHSESRINCHFYSLLLVLYQRTRKLGNTVEGPEKRETHWPSGLAQVVKHHPIHQEVTSLISGPGYLPRLWA